MNKMIKNIVLSLALICSCAPIMEAITPPVSIKISTSNIELSVNPSKLTFGSVKIGSSKTEKVRIIIANTNKNVSCQLSGEDKNSFSIISEVNGNTGGQIIITCSPKKEGNLKAILNVTIGNEQRSVVLEAQGVN